jgi:hypothetical protein
MNSEYEVEDAASRVNTKTDKMEGLDISMKYNYVLSLVHYTDHVNFMEGLHNLGDLNDMSMREVTKYMRGHDVLVQSSMEIGDVSPEDFTENGVYDRLATQFSWGSKYNPPFVHSSEALNAVAATLGKLGK